MNQLAGNKGRDWLPCWGISRELGHLSAGLITLLDDFTCTRSPFGGIGYPVARFHLHSVTFRRDWLPCCAISRGFGHHSAGLVTLLRDFTCTRSPFGGLVTLLGDFTWIRSPFGLVGYPVARFLVHSGTIRRDWLPCCWISCGFGHHSAGLVTLLRDFSCTRAPLGRIDYPVGGYPADSGTIRRV